MKYFALFAFSAIIVSLGAALFFMVKRDSHNVSQRQKKMATALGVRVGLSILLFASILLAWKLGYIRPTGIADGV